MEAYRTDRFRGWNGEVMAESVEGSERIIQLLRPSGASRVDDHTIEVQHYEEGPDHQVSDGPTGRPGQADGSGAGDGVGPKQSSFIARIVGQFRGGGNAGEPKRPPRNLGSRQAVTSDADFATKIETAKGHLAYSTQVMQETTERAESLRRINRTGNFVEGLLVPELRKDPHHE